MLDTMSCHQRSRRGDVVVSRRPNKARCDAHGRVATARSDPTGWNDAARSHVGAQDNVAQAIWGLCSHTSLPLCRIAAARDERSR